MSEEVKEKKKKKMKGWLIALIIVVSVLLTAVAAAWIVYEHFFSLTNYVPDPGSIEISSDILKSLDEVESTIDPYEASRIEAELESIRAAEEERQRLEESLRAEQESLSLAEEEMRRLQSEAE
jgi:cytoskeletal protein RodZ